MPSRSRSEEESAGLVSALLFSWMRPLFQRASQLQRGSQNEYLQHDDLLTLPSMDGSVEVRQRFEDAWNAYESQNANQSKQSKQSKDNHNDGDQSSSKKESYDQLQAAILAVIGRPFWIAGVVKMCNSTLQFSFPLLIRALLRYLEDEATAQEDGNASSSSSSLWNEYRGYWWALFLFLAMMAKAVVENIYFQRVHRAGYQTRVAVSMAVYDKALRVSNVTRQSTTVGELVNLLQVDATKLEMVLPQVHVLWDGLYQIVGYLVILYTLIGWPCIAGLVVMLLAGPLQTQIMQKLLRLNREMVTHTDARVKQTNETLTSMECVKLYTWQDAMTAAVASHRQAELESLQRVATLRGASRAYMTALPGLVAVTSFVVYAVYQKDDDAIRASTLFAALNAFEQLRFPLLFYPVALAQWAQARVSAMRVQAFLQAPEVAHTTMTTTSITTKHDNQNNQDDSSSSFHPGGDIVRDETAAGEITVSNATVYWSDPNVPLPSTPDKKDNEKSKDEKSIGRRSSTASSMHFTERTSSNGDGDNDSDNNKTESPSVQYPKPILQNIDLHVANGELCAVVGRVASGKSTLCSAILNEAVLAEGRIALHGKVAYAAQSPWILNATLRDNIVFGRPFDPDKYRRVIHACQLEYDLKMLEHGDETEIGERGINLSGGQKQRISVARAAYSDADTIILDDPLSALDPEVGRQVFANCIQTLMAGKTRLFVTNNLQFLSGCDKIVVLGNQRVLEQGTYQEIMTNPQSSVKALIEEMLEAANKGSEKKDDDKTSLENESTKETAKSPMGSRDETDQVGKADETKKRKNEGLLTKEERKVGAVSLSAYKKYIQCGGGWSTFLLVYCGYILSTANQIGTTSWVSYWTSDPQYENHSKAFYLGIYFMLAVTLGLVSFEQAYILARFGVSAGETLHHKLFASILKAPQSFFDTTPLGRIISRFSKDMYSIDTELPQQFDFFLFTTLRVVASLATILFVTPYFGVAIVPLLVFYLRVMNYFRQVSRETKRLDSISRSPIYAQFSEVLGGLSTIRAYAESSRFLNIFTNIVDENTRANYCNKNADRWLSVRLEMVGATIAGLAAVFAVMVVVSDNIFGQGSDSNFASLAGLSLTYAVQLTGLLNFSVRSFAQLEAAMNSVERVNYYSDSIPQEAPATTEELMELRKQENRNDGRGVVHKLAADWPDKGEIVFSNLRMRYRDDTPLVLKGVNVRIAPGERVGVCGRTGSGKSSLLLTLLRMVEPYIDENEPYVAPIAIDGVDTMQIGLNDLRSRVGIIPQHPALFSGTIRSNIDPFNEHTDTEIWDALEKCGMKTAVLEMPGDLLAPVSENGGNLSAGTCQMLVLGRALLRQCRILCLDEATASVDYETDRAIQRTIREAFPNCTVLTIAHRINTIMDSDKILVMDNGYAAEFGSPTELLAKEGSIFSEIVRQSKTN